MTIDTESLVQFGYAARRAGNLDEALAFYGQAALIFRHQSAPLKLAHTLRHIADIEREQGAIEESRTGYEEALAIYRANPVTPKLDLANAIRGYALLLTETGEREQAHSLWVEAKDLYSDLIVDAGVQECAMQLRKYSKL